MDGGVFQMVRRVGGGDLMHSALKKTAICRLTGKPIWELYLDGPHLKLS